VKLSNLFLKSSNFFGLTSDVIYTVLLRGWQFLAGGLTLIFIIHALSPEEQGLYYIFYSILAIQIFFDLGLTTVLVQFASYEKSKMKWIKNKLSGDSVAKSRLSSLFRFSIKWYFLAILIMISSLIPSGLYFISIHDLSLDPIYWKYSWIFILLATAFNLALSPIFSILEGCDLIKDVARFRLIQDFFSYLVFWGLLYCGFGLFSAGLFQLLRFLFSISWLFYNKRSIIYDILNAESKNNLINWRSEIWPMQWRYGISALSGFFIFQFFPIALYTFFGPIVAGRMGMSISITSAIAIIAMSWLTTKVPKISFLIHTKKPNELDHYFYAGLKQALAVSIIIGTILAGLVFYFSLNDFTFIDRIVDPISMMFLILASILNVIIFSFATLLRAFKVERFSLHSFCTGVIILFTTILLGKKYGEAGVCLGYFIAILLVALPWAYLIFVKNRRMVS
jgi:hypothetical protein